MGRVGGGVRMDVNEELKFLWVGVGLGGQGGCEQRSEVCEHSKTFLGGGGGERGRVGGGVGLGGGGGSGWM